jgi:4-aminobutyrate aminotransferase/(S)-3-amino-2-methylpropionate transaminase
MKSYDGDQGQNVANFINFKKSKGNFFVDVDGNVILDLHCHYHGLPLGYNHDKMINLRDSNAFDRFIGSTKINSDAPPHDYVDMIRETMMPLGPDGMGNIHFSDDGQSGANESAINVALSKYAKMHGVNNADLKVLSFEGAFHGRGINMAQINDPSLREVTGLALGES